MLKHFVLGLCLCIWHLIGTCASEPVRLVTRDEEPYGSFKDDHTFDGVAVRVVDCAFRSMNRSYQLKVYPWERAQMIAEKGEADGLFPAAMTPDRLMWSEASEKIAAQRWIWVLPWDSKLDPNSDDFKINARVGAFFGSKRLKTLELGRYNVVLRPQSELQLLKAFMMGRADAILVGDMAFAEAMKTLNLNPNQFRTVFAQDRPMHVFFTKKFLQTEPDFLKQFNAQISGCQ